MRCVLVSHTHWDREWYRTFESFRARLVDTVDRVLELVTEDTEFHFQLDGQAIVVEDYLEIRPDRRETLLAAVRGGRIAIGPWYVQPDSLIPTGESHVRNLLEGRRVAEAHGGSSAIAYTPDSFGHPDQFPQLFSGFGLGPFVYWRGHGDELDELPCDWRWRGRDGSEITACHLDRGYFAAWGLADDTDAAAKRLARLSRQLASRSRRDCVLLMNGLDHMLPDANTRAVAEALAKETGAEVVRGLLDAYAEGIDAAALPVFAGELIGGRAANLLPGVWSTHVPLKLAHRRCETALVSRAEPFAALARLLGGPDERSAISRAWRALLPNQAHDSLCGCSQDRVHVQMAARLDAVEELADETTLRMLDRLAGLDTDRQPPRERDEILIAVWNPSPHARTDVVQIPLAGFPAYTKHGVNPLLELNRGLAGITVDGRAARVVVEPGERRPWLSPHTPVHTVEAVVEDVPAFGYRRVRLARGDASPDLVDRGREIAAGDIRVSVDAAGCLDVAFGGVRFHGLLAVEDAGDRGDSYDCDPLDAGEPRLRSLEVLRRRHESGLAELDVRRVFEVPAALAEDRSSRSAETVPLALRVVARVAPGVPRVDLRVALSNTASDHRLRLLFPSGAPLSIFTAATTFGRAERTTAARDDARWIHPAPRTFPLQGHLEAGGLGVAAPGLIEAEVTPDGVVALTLVRGIGWLSRPDLDTRPGEAGPSLRTPGAQCLGEIEAQLSLYAAPDPAAAHDAECTLVAGGVGRRPLAPDGVALLDVQPRAVAVSALKPAEAGDAVVLRLLNPTAEPLDAVVSLAPVLAAAIADVRSVRLDETPAEFAFSWHAGRLAVALPPFALRSFRLLAQPGGAGTQP